MSRRERELERKGYRLVGLPLHNPEDAKKEAEEWRKKGYYAQVVETATRVVGYHNYSMWIKPKRRD